MPRPAPERSTARELRPRISAAIRHDAGKKIKGRKRHILNATGGTERPPQRDRHPSNRKIMKLHLIIMNQDISDL